MRNAVAFLTCMGGVGGGGAKKPKDPHIFPRIPTDYHGSRGGSQDPGGCSPVCFRALVFLGGEVLSEEIYMEHVAKGERQ